MLLSTLLLVFQLWRGAAWDTRITALLPSETRNTLLEQYAQQQDELGSNRFLLLISGEQASAAVADLENRLQQAQLIHDQSQARNDWLPAIQPHMAYLLADTLRDLPAREWADHALESLFAPGRGRNLRQDPFALQTAWIEQLRPAGIEWQDGYPLLHANAQNWLVFNAELRGSAYDMDTQQRLSHALAEFGQQHPDLQTMRAGLVFHAAHAAQQAQWEVSIIGGSSLLLITLLLWSVFRRPTSLLSLLLPVVCGVLFALPLTWLIFTRLNLLTLAFGISLIGIGIDYALHVQCYRLTHPDSALHKLWPALRLGLLSSLLAYLAQLLTPLPGLRQMACFLMLGLIGAWLTARLWLPRWPLQGHSGNQRMVAHCNRLRLPARWQAPLAFGLMLGLPLLLITADVRPNNDLRQLNPSPDSLVAEQKTVMHWLQQASGQRFVLLTAQQPQALLERLEALHPLLSELQASDELSAFSHIAQRVPSLQQQQADHALINHAYAEALPLLLEQAGLPSELMQPINAELERSQPLFPEQWLARAAGEPDQNLWWQSSAGTHAVILLGDLSNSGEQRLLDALHQREIYHDRVAALGQKLGQLRDTVSYWLLAACLLLLPLLLWRYRRQAWRALLPPFGALLLTLTILSWSGQGITLFHLLGLLLVLGIGLDSGIFNTEHGEQGASWLAITLSCASSLIAFGLLSFSSTPALQQLGLTCLIGLSSAWILTLISRPPLATTHGI
ncbi:MMPL family transporter [Halopseudomonas salegens]|uniref:MMPL family transporter n=1 Tax=Halopseudomonas salegens TaxID=1434072 RepID=UPI0018D352C1|nr:MMPL family transporter [Halopseudomonas salegens]